MRIRYRYQKHMIIGIVGVLLLLVAGCSVYFGFFRSPKSMKQKSKEVLLPNRTMEDQEQKLEEVLVQIDVKGQVQEPGLYKLNSENRVLDAIIAAGGLTEQADTSVLNLSRKVFDEMVIIVYSKEEVADFRRIKEVEQVVQDRCQNALDTSLTNDACIENESSIIPSKISLNQATLEMLMTLPGIGEAKAKEILSYREEIGAFESIEQLKDISGIGEAIFDKIKDFITP